MNKFKIGKREIGEGAPLYFIADIAANHDGDLNRAIKLIELAKESGANAAKFQNFQASKIVSKKGFESLGKQLSHQYTWKKSVYETYVDASLSFDWTKMIQEKCDEIGIDYFTSPYDFESIDHVDPYVDAYKIGSGDITWLEIIEYIAKKGKPVILATGASTIEDVQRAMRLLESITDEVVLMQCNTNYTASPGNFKYINLNVLKTYNKMYPNVILGLSDHTPGHSTVLGAVALGARVFEKHFTDDNTREGPDHKFAMTPDTWKEMVKSAAELDYALGDGIKKVEDNEKEAAIIQRRSLRFKQCFNEGHIIQHQDLFPLRPISEDGIQPYEIANVVGKKLLKKVGEDEYLRKGDYE